MVYKSCKNKLLAYVSCYVCHFLFLIKESSQRKSRKNDIQHIFSCALIWLCADDFSDVEP